MQTYARRREVMCCAVFALDEAATGGGIARAYGGR